MALYFFDTDDGRETIRDEVGIEIGDPADIGKEAVRLLRQVTDLKTPVGLHMMVANVCDRSGTAVYRGMMTIQGERL